MIFTPIELAGAYVIELEPLWDERGFFARSWCQREFEAQGLNPRLVQCNISHNVKKGTLRGMHFQAPPFEEAKLVRCTRGAIFDVIIDLRPKSRMYLQWMAVVLSEGNNKMLYVPEGFAHGFQTTEDHTEVCYQMSEFHVPDHARGVRWNDRLFNITWPEGERIISIKDQSYADFDPALTFSSL